MWHVARPPGGVGRRRARPHGLRRWRRPGSRAGTTYDYVTAVRPLAYDNARAACRGHSLTSLAYEYATSGRTFTTAARSWARRNQPDVRLRDVSYRGCRDGLRETASRPVLIDKPPLSSDEIEIYLLEYSTCLGLTLAELVQDYGLDPSGLTLEQAVREVVRRATTRATEASPSTPAWPRSAASRRGTARERIGEKAPTRIELVCEALQASA